MEAPGELHHLPPPPTHDTLQATPHLGTNLAAVVLPPIPPINQPPLDEPPPNVSNEPEPEPEPELEQEPENENGRERHSGSEDGTGSEHDDSEDDGDAPSARWQPIAEDTSEPCEDELKYIDSKGEHSALDHSHWEKKAFLQLHDPELVPLSSGKLDWLIEGFNGTKEKPNNERVMRSPTVSIGGLDWQIKFYPKGNDSDFLSCYIECPSLQSADFAEYQDFEHLPFPSLKGAENIKKRRTIAVQLGVLMYNPSEPRVHEFKSEATQLSKASADFGWKYFSQQSRYEFHYRQHTQRQAILRNDKLAFSAYIRIVHDPTGCMWQDPRCGPDQIISATGLRPFTKSLQYIAGAVPLLHFAPFRKWVQGLRPDTQLAKWLQPLLLKMYTRKRSSTYGTRGTIHEGDVIELLWRVATCVQNEYTDGVEPSRFLELVGAFHSEKSTACGGSRLNTKENPSIQAAIYHHSKLIARPALLTLELQRQEHDKKERKWKKLTNKVQVEDKIDVGGSSYTLFAFITHCGHLQSSRYNSYVRPKGIGRGWYAYQDGKVTCLTEKQARERHSGMDVDDDRPRTPENGYDSPMTEHHEALAEVTSVVMYVRDDATAETFDGPDEEVWLPSQCTQEEFSDPPPTAVHEYFKSTSGGHYGQHGQQPMSEEEFARLAAIREAIDRAAVEATPEPVSLDGEDVVMKDADDESTYSVEAQETEPAHDGSLEVGTLDWLGRPYYQGQFKSRKYHGGGHLIASNGDEYLGSFQDGLFHGYGKLIASITGDVYEGSFQAGEMHGEGKLIEHSTGNVFTGSFKEGKKCGQFVLRGTVTEEDKSRCSICYEKEMNTAFYDCGHVVACRDCAAHIDVCPICRRRIVARMQLYGVRISQC